MIMDNAEKAAGLLFLLGEDNCRKIASHLGKEETEKLMQVRKPCTRLSLLRELKSYLERQEKNDWRTALKNALCVDGCNPLGFVAETDTEKLFSVLEKESDLVTAVVLKYAGKEKSAEILDRYSDEKRNEILRTMLRSGETAPRILETVAQSLRKKLI